MNNPLLFNKNKGAKSVCILTSLFILFASNAYALEKTFKNSESKNSDLFKELEVKLIELKAQGNTTDTRVANGATCTTAGVLIDGETLQGTTFPECGQRRSTRSNRLYKLGVYNSTNTINKFCKVFGYDGVKNNSIQSATYSSSSNETSNAFIIRWQNNAWTKYTGNSYNVVDEFICETTKECIEDSDCQSDALTCQNNQCVDCSGTHNGTAVVDECGVCGGDNSTCADCAGVPNGTAVKDECGVCGGDNSTCADCAGTPNGTAVVDECGVCGGDNSTCADCAGTPNGTAVVDECGVCGGDNSTCADCAGTPNGTAVVDECGVCGGDNSTCADCAGTPNGTAVVDECGVCGGDNSTCLDCAGVPNGTSVEDRCGICDGDGTSCCLEDSECVKDKNVKTSSA